ncbi:hypothetical protein T265_06792 [Opisthorchis viverrini]|uniref:START domain-containing protein n=1 Tax=Opisthorchis viverrini TaxID=6198 RepID=A0A075AD32_OPIVI|nr:hypothetical protein T265_06792 [Opisthorchis viverrini]KER25814.1 hypothetical protein T265_06792 [Opisthorchis viverrini]
MSVLCQSVKQAMLIENLYSVKISGCCPRNTHKRLKRDYTAQNANDGLSSFTYHPGVSSDPEAMARGVHGVGVALSPGAERALRDWIPMNSLPVTQLNQAQNLCIKTRPYVVSVYALTDCGSDAERDAFYLDLSGFIRQPRSIDIVILVSELHLVRAHFPDSPALWWRKGYGFFYQTWNFRSPAFVRLCRATQRAFLTNVLFFRHTGELTFRRLHERYWIFRRRVLRKESRITQAQRILLGGCLISFAQDKISDEELACTIKSLAVDVDAAADNDGSSFRAEDEAVPPGSNVPADDNSSNQNVSSSAYRSGDPFSNPPLTKFVRELRQEVLRYATEFLHPVPPQDECIPVVACTITEPVNSSDTVDSHFSSLLGGLNLQPDGTGFVDNTWDLVINKADLRVWRRAIDFDANQPPTAHENTEEPSTETQKNGEKSRCRYEYRPQREYIYVRRWWLEPNALVHKPDTPTEESLTGEHGRYAVVLSRSSGIASPEGHQAVNGSSPLTRWNERVKQTTVFVKSYRSAMLIEAHERFSELGMNYYLVYYDDPQLPMGDSALSLLSGKAMNQFMNQLHSAALTLTQTGLPSGIDAVVFHMKPKEFSDTPSSADAKFVHPERCPLHESLNPKRTERPKPRFFADYVNEPTRLSNAAY